MLPQMMPMPWIFVFFMIFFSVFSISLYFSFISFSFSSSPKMVKSSISSISW